MFDLCGWLFCQNITSGLMLVIQTLANLPDGHDMPVTLSSD